MRQKKGNYAGVAHCFTFVSERRLRLMSALLPMPFAALPDGCALLASPGISPYGLGYAEFPAFASVPAGATMPSQKQ